MGEAASTDAISPEHVYCPPGQNRTEKMGIPNCKVYITSVRYSYLITPVLIQEAIRVLRTNCIGDRSLVHVKSCVLASAVAISTNFDSNNFLLHVE
jgi:hypothetical protein